MSTTYEIHPSIGVARVGTSENHFIGPQADGPTPARYRDEVGNLLRQSAQFRVFRCERVDGQLVGAEEVTADIGQITWTVHLANRKAAGEIFPPPADVPPDERPRRNVHEHDRSRLIIDPGPRSLSGPAQTARFDSGRFKDALVPLGEIQTTPDGRLLVLGGFGRSGFVRLDGEPSPIRDFANNSDWFDDVSDGPVEAVIRIDGQEHQAAPAWTIVAPPDFAPGITNFVTLYDVARDVAVRQGWIQVPETPSFVRDVYPILARPFGYSWVSRLASKGHGPRRPGDFSARWAELADPGGDATERQRILDRLRDPTRLPPSEPFTMPRLHDDTLSEDVLPPTSTQYLILERWAAGVFVGDWGAPPSPSESLPDALDRRALEACSGGPFFPGIEAGRILAQAESYSAPYRLDASVLVPGDITEGNAVPWQADFLACTFDQQFRLGWWPAQRPDQVFPDLESVRSLRSRDWARGVDMYEGMVDHWHSLGVVVERADVDGQSMFLETERLLPEV